MAFATFSKEALPPGFKYPEAFLALAEGESAFDEIYPWWFFDATTVVGQQVARHIDEKGLVPFAKTDLYDDIACFIGSDTSGNPPILVLCSADDRSYGYASYQQWLEAATKDAQHDGATRT